MIHLVCPCGGLVSVAPPEGARTVQCRACSRVLDVPDPAILGPGADAPPSSLPVPATAAPAPAVPAFDTDERLNLHVLEREAARLLVMGRIVLAAGFAGAAAAGVIPGRTAAERALLGSVALFASTAAWCAFRAARASCLAAVALAQRQREILRGMAKA